MCVGQLWNLAPLLVEVTSLLQKFFKYWMSCVYVEVAGGGGELGAVSKRQQMSS